MNTPYTGMLGLNDEKDFYKMTVASSGLVNIIMSSSEIKALYWRIYDENGKSITDRKYESCSNAGTIYTSYDAYLNTGTYYLEVERYSSENVAYHGTYSLRLNYTNTNESFRERNAGSDNTIDTANHIYFNTTYIGQASLNDDADFYQFKILSSGTVTITASAKMKYFYYQFFDENGQNVTSRFYEYNSDSNIYVNKSVEFKSSGTYYLKIQKYSDTFLGTYSFSLQTNADTEQSTTYTVSYNANGGTGAPSSQTKTYNVNLTLRSDTPSKSYTVSYNANGGNCSISTSTRYCTFRSWNTKSDGSGTSYSPGGTYSANAGSTLYAQWSNPTYGSLPTPTRSGYTFGGWYTSSSGGTRIYDSTITTGSCTLYAHWTSVPLYTLSYNANGGSGAPSSQSGNGTVTISSTVPSRFGYTFLGWSTSSTATTASYQPKGSISLSANTTLYAVWKGPGTIGSSVTASSYSAAVSRAGQGVYFKFTPSVTTNYRFESYGNYDPIAYLYNEDGTQIVGNNNSGDGNNFRIDYTCTAGKTYYLHVYHYDASVTGTITFIVRRAYTISFNAKGGTGAPSAQRKYHGLDISLSTTIPTKSYTLTFDANGGSCSTTSSVRSCKFKNWNSSSDGSGSTYSSGATYSGNGNATLYAQWTNPTCGTLPTPTRSGYVFRGWYSTASGGTKFTSDSTLTMTRTLYAHWTPKISISQQPVNVSGRIGETVKLTVTASNATGYQWYYSKDGGTSWYKSSETGNTTKTLSVGVSSASAAKIYKCKLTSSAESVFTNSVKISIIPSAKITTQPVDTSGREGETVKFSVTAENASTYQWFFSNDGTNWYKSGSTGNATRTLSVTVSSTSASRLYKCKVSDSTGYSDISKTASLSIIPSVKITSQPVNTSVHVEEKAKFTVTAERASSYQWFFSNDGTNWYKSGSTGNTTRTLTVDVNSTNASRLYKCKVSDSTGYSVVSNVVKITLLPCINVTSQPVSVSAKLGDSVTFSVSARNVNTYQWFFSNDGGTNWYKSGSDGNTTRTLTVNVTEADASKLYKCKMTDSTGHSDLTNAVKITLLSKVKITSQPVSVSGKVGDTVSFKVVASNVSSYQWFFSNDGINWYKSGSTGNNTSTLKVKLTSDNINRQYKCKLTDSEGKSITTDSVRTI